MRARTYGQLRFVHLSAHLDTIQILTIEQVQMYNTIRGYDSGGTDNTTSTSNYDTSNHHQLLMKLNFRVPPTIHGCLRKIEPHDEVVGSNPILSILSVW
jgi:hypothetical protein